MRHDELVKRVEDVGCKFHRSSYRQSRGGKTPKYYIIVGENPDGSPKVQAFDGVLEIIAYIQARRAANAAESPEVAQTILREAGF